MALPQITALARRASRSDPDDVREQTLIHKAVLELTEVLHQSGARDLARCLETVSVITDALGRGEWLDPRRMADVVAKLLHVVDEQALELPPAPIGNGEAERARIALLSDTAELPKINDIVLGEVLFHLGFVSRQKILQALHVQHVNGIRIGEALVACGAVTDEQVQAALRLQERIRSSAAATWPPVSEDGADDGTTQPSACAVHPAHESLLGEVMVHLEFVTPEQIEKGLELQREKGIRIGEALVELGFVTWDHVVEAIGVQKRLRHASGLRSPA